MMATKRWIGALLVALALAAASPGALANGGNIWIGGSGGHFGFSFVLPNHHYDHVYNHYGYPSYYYGRHYYGHRAHYRHNVHRRCYWRYGHKYCYRARY